tara:strand:+ start:1773 stop:2033 length:261 start_codon:yes stop_codon:yes gene_type:complete
MDENMTASTRHPVRKLSTWAFNLKAYSTNAPTTKAATEKPIGVRPSYGLKCIVTLQILFQTFRKLVGYQILRPDTFPLAITKSSAQ